ncbi:MAG: tRNA (adenosine(37)-N6)-threonylcarbamoyltransferase complex dimerization subunit type 1 TsaB [Patescibacteria group bacterium]
MILFIDTTSLETKIGLLNETGNFIDQIEWTSRFNQSEELISKIEDLLQKNRIKKDDLGKIVVITGPGSYTGVRIGVTTANFIGLGLNIPVLGLKKSSIVDIGKIISGDNSDCFLDPVMPYYERLPNITKPKKKL